MPSASAASSIVRYGTLTETPISPTCRLHSLRVAKCLGDHVQRQRPDQRRALDVRDELGRRAASPRSGWRRRTSASTRRTAPLAEIDDRLVVDDDLVLRRAPISNSRTMPASSEPRRAAAELSPASRFVANIWSSARPSSSRGRGAVGREDAPSRSRRRSRRCRRRPGTGGGGRAAGDRRALPPRPRCAFRARGRRTRRRRSRATVSLARTTDSSRRAMLCSTWSPASWPRMSLTSLKPSRSTAISAKASAVRRARCSACSIRSSSSARLGSPVSASRSASDSAASGPARESEGEDRPRRPSPRRARS